MPLTDLDSLKSEMKDWAIDRPDLVPKFQDMIDMVTNDLNKVLRTRQQQMKALLTLDAEGSVALPPDYLEWRSVKALTNPVSNLISLSPEGLSDIYPNSYGGWPTHFVVENNTLTVMPVTDAPIEFKYWKRIPHLTEAAPTNWLLTENPNLYLYGAIKVVEIYKRNNPGAQLFGEVYNGGMDGMLRETKRAQWSRTRSRIAGRSTP